MIDHLMLGESRLARGCEPNSEQVEVGTVRQRAVALAILLRQSAAAGDTLAVASAATVLERMRQARIA
jgi:hypothetical protein